MPQIRDSFTQRLSREYWTTEGGKKLFPHEFEDKHLSNTIGLIHRKSKLHRIEEALILCDMVHRIGYDGHNINGYYQAYKKQVDSFLDPSTTDKEWLKQNSKIYVLLMEEANFRGIEANNAPPKKVFATKIDGRYTFGSNFTYHWTSN